MPGNLESEEGRDPERGTEISRRDASFNIAFPFWSEVRKLIFATYYPPFVLFAAIRYPENTEYYIHSSAITALLDNLFLYVPLINENTKCLMPDKRLMIVALILRFVTDLRYVAKIFHKMKVWWTTAKNNGEKLGITSNVVAILPIPQVAILVFLPNMRGFESLAVMKFLNSVIFFQYLQRVYPIYRYCKNLNKEMHDDSIPERTWIPSLINLLIYLLASHVIGSFWYLFSVQREIDCWKDTCQRGNSCEFDVRCDTKTFRNVALLNDSCPIKSPNATVYDFGIFLHALQSGMQESNDIPGKFLICFSWGVRNLSSFASNLQTSSYRWEILFVVAISISGLMLFIYFLGHVQTFTQVAGKSERSQKKLKILEKKVKSVLLDPYGLRTDPNDSIKYVVEKKHSEDPKFVLENMFSIFSFKHEVVDEKSLQSNLNTIRETLFFDKLKELDGDLLGLHMNETVLKEICKYLDPVIYPKRSCIILEGEPLDMMFIITQGIALSHRRHSTDQSMPTTSLEEGGNWYGEELLTWAASQSTSYSDLPKSRSTIKVHKDVELFALRAADLRSVFREAQRRQSIPATTSPIQQIVMFNSSSVLQLLNDIVIEPGRLLR